MPSTLFKQFMPVAALLMMVSSHSLASEKPLTMIDQIVANAAKQGSAQLIPMLGDEAARKTVEIGKEIILKAGLDIPIRVVAGRNVPTAVGNLEIVIPYRGMDKYTQEQLPFVVAHELAHIVLNHAAQRMELAAKTCSPGFSHFIRVVNCVQDNLVNNEEIKSQVNQLNREQEHQADVWAYNFLKSNNISADTLGALKSAHKTSPQGGHAHPPLITRLQVVEQEMERVKGL